MNEHSDEKPSASLNLLTRFGLSKDEATLFVLLSRVGKKQATWLRGSDISKLSKKGRVRTYQILQRLSALGLLDVDLSRPKKYSAVSPQVALRRLLSIQETKLTELSHLESEAIQSLGGLSRIPVESILGQQEEKPKSSVTVLQGLANIQNTLREVLAGSNVSISINQESVEHIATMLGYLSEKPKSTRIILSSPTRPILKRFAVTLDNMESRWRKGSSPTFILTDNSTMFLFYSMSSVKKSLLSPERRLSTVSQMTIIDSETYTNQMRDLFEMMVQSSHEVKVK